MIQYKQTEKGREILRVLFGVEYFGYMNERDLKFIMFNKLKMIQSDSK